MDKVQRAYREAELTVFPPVPDDQIWCSVRGQLVGATDCATDACIAPEQRPFCWAGHLPARPVEAEHA